MKALGTDFILYEVSDLERSVAFYRDTLGLELEIYLKDILWAELKAEPTTLALFDPSQHRPQAPEPQTGGATLFLAVEDVNGAVEELKGKGAPVIMEPLETPVCWMAAVADPDGNAVGLHQRKDGSFG